MITNINLVDLNKNLHFSNKLKCQCTYLLMNIESNIGN